MSPDGDAFHGGDQHGFDAIASWQGSEACGRTLTVLPDARRAYSVPSAQVVVRLPILVMSLIW